MNIKRATLADLQEVSRLFDLYRQFYEQPADLDKARDYIEARLTNDESIVYLATDDEGRGVGFTQLYATFCSVAAAPIWILYDLYVDAGARKGGVGTALMNRAKQLAEESGAARIQLETAVDNTTAQSVYEALGYER
ncbi:MAG: GNAT family N-acetyltransferase, partial [Gammaproteobacteria bacterium]|nr:GNAT family N-acetyltransferase [Gammaproteobacteria bacterium]